MREQTQESQVKSQRQERQKTRVDSELSEEFKAKVGIHQGSVLSPFLFAVLVNAVTEFSRMGELSDLLFAGDLVPMSETFKGVKN